MRFLSELGNTFTKTLIILCVVGCVSVYGIYLSQKIINETEADRILTSVWAKARKEKIRLDPEMTSENEEEDLSDEYESTRAEYNFFVAPDSTVNLIKIETGKKEISVGVCKALENKLLEVQWRDVFEKVVIVDRQGNERTNILTYSCPYEKVPSLRFYVPFVKEEPVEEMPEEPEEEEVPEYDFPEPPSPKEFNMPALPPSVSTPTTTTAPSVKNTSFNPTVSSAVSCPFGASLNGNGGLATKGCRCNNSGETWNGKECVIKCSENKVLVGGKCLCPERSYPKKGFPDLCVECNETSDCFQGNVCYENRCVPEQEKADCRWGICQTCDENGNRSNLLDRQKCEVGGLQGLCNDNGTCYPIEGRRCSSVRGCPSGKFCNYGGTFYSSKRQKGKFGQTPNVCQLVVPLEFKHKNVTYYYNSEQDLKSWCRAANNKPNCMWGYLAKSGAESWCFSLGKRLLTKEEIADVWDILRKKLPKTYKGYAYWVKEGVWMENNNGRRSFGTSHPDGYGGKGGVVCR